MQVVNIRGTTGSGKSTIVRNLIHIADTSQVISISQGVKGHLLRFSWPDKYCTCIVIGRYEKNSNFGGVDAISKISYVEPAIWKALQIAPVVVFEGLLISHSFERWINFSNELKEKQKASGVDVPFGMIWVFTIPSFRENIKRLHKRNNIVLTKTLREVKGDDYILNFISRYKSIIRIYKKSFESNQSLYRVNDFKHFMKKFEKILKLHSGSKMKRETNKLKGFIK